MATSELFKKLNEHRNSYISTDEIENSVGLSHPALLQLVRRHTKELESVSKERLNFRHDDKGRKVYLLNPEQATLLVVFMRSTGVVAEFSTDLVKQLYSIQRKRSDEETAEINKQLRRAVNNSGNQDYQKYHDLAYLIATGKRAKQLRNELSIPSGKTITDFLSDKQVKRVNEAKQKITTMLEHGKSYQEIRFSLYHLNQLQGS
ncbi:Rha family transcriptional regulator [Fructilactobacillus myrtifloralis]|uniref:Rha family transcriptional regulator n=1 Tax=Fructilactobacillus myrtifloralis TaxID=2940301 RepID=A0ABY5BRB8_9LACO|nr:Rha family transcriptional regulator [Fructilactobacillus myrtifloralis]USS85121.1 Rha family transcriptional regulator [Fructilactobacillus myrtifloralis]